MSGLEKHYVKGGVHSLQGDTIQVLPPDQTSFAKITTSGVTARIALPTGSAVLRLTATEDMWLKFGDVTVDAAADDILFLTGTEVIAVPRDSTGIPYTYVAAIQDTTAGILNIVRMGS